MGENPALVRSRKVGMLDKSNLETGDLFMKNVSYNMPTCNQ